MDAHTTAAHASTTVEKHGYVGFLAGMCSGVTKILVGHPFDTIKVRLQTSTTDQFKGTWDCFSKTVKLEGPLALYKGAAAPLVGWSMMDSVQLGSLQLYRKLLKNNVYEGEAELPTLGHATAGLLGGLTVCLVATPIEHVKSRLQIQYNSTVKLYSGPLDCGAQLIRQAGLFNGLYHGFVSSLVFRTHFFFYWGCYDVLTKWGQKYTPLSAPAINFWAGGLCSQFGWLFGLPPDVVKQVIMTDNVANPRFKTWMSAARFVYDQRGWKGFFRGLTPCMIRAFPTNAMALVVFEGVLRTLDI
ncbi:mitochondrial carrier domain-containing protein [Limtongia smithiae]|uniref:mitochondrial carrier domain-containing protein n=1 Tax=Limtongia smithiae TaxID=1125753 RepID=UPI0034CD7139